MDIQKIIPAQPRTSSRDKPLFDGEERQAGALGGNFTFATLQTTEFQVIHPFERHRDGYHFKTHKSCNVGRRYQNNGGNSQEGRSNSAASQNMATIRCTQNVSRKSTFAGRGFAGQSPMVRPWNRPDTLFCCIRVFRGRTHPSLPNLGKQGESFSQGFHRAFNEVSGWMTYAAFLDSRTSRAVTTPLVFSSIASAHFVGIRSHCWTAWYVNPRARATADCEPKNEIVFSSVLSMSQTLPENLALCKYFLHGMKTSFPCRIPA